jgi:DNA repair exonuclease SbcCD ATPase subunit
MDTLRKQLVDSGLSEAEWRALLAEGGGDSGARHDDATIARLLSSVEDLAAQQSGRGADAQAMTLALETIGREVESLIQHTHGKASSLAQRVDADRSTVAEIEQHARDSGIGLQLSRKELLGSLAEINQELVQPLTTSSAMLQMLAAGKMGDLNDSQRDVLKVATEGMERLEKLIAYLQRISGFPVELCPDHALLSDVYGKPGTGSV